MDERLYGHLHNVGTSGVGSILSGYAKDFGLVYWLKNRHR